MLATPEEGFDNIWVGFCGLPVPAPTWKSPVLGHRLGMKHADRSFRIWLGHKLTRSPVRFNSTPPDYTMRPSKIKVGELGKSKKLQTHGARAVARTGSGGQHCGPRLPPRPASVSPPVEWGQWH